MTLANALTVSRLFLSLIYFVLLLELPANGRLAVPLALLLAAGLTDILDGYVARLTETTSEFGRVADAFIDRVLAAGSFVIFLAWGLVPAWVVLIVVVREFLVGGMRNLADARGLRFKATIFGKTKFATQFAACVAVILYRAYFNAGGAPLVAMDVVVYLSALSTFVSGAVYLANYRRLVGA